MIASVEHHPEAFGLSIDGEGKTTPSGREVTEVTAGHSVDIVSDPATSSGLFEERDARRTTPAPDRQRELDREESSLIDAVSLTRDAGWAVYDGPRPKTGPPTDSETESLIAAFEGR